jgi:DNA-directed RNA polymerase specialized sigma24 family protein
MDVVHDFFAEAWPGLAGRHDPGQVSLKTYATAAFVRFARRRLVEEAKWRRGLALDPEELAPDDRARSSTPEPCGDLDRRSVELALRTLDPADRGILRQRFGDDELPEREIARRQGSTRHCVRGRLVEALARLAVALGESGIVPERDLVVARAAWTEGMSIEEAAAHLGLRETEVRCSLRRLRSLLGDATKE